mgnify:CR=1 FL=1
MENSRIADIFDEIADLLDLKDANRFRIRSYRNAARTVRELSFQMEDIDSRDKDFDDIPNIGEKTAHKIREILETGTCRRLEDLKKQSPGNLTRLMDVPSLGPRKAMQIHKELNVSSLEELKQAAQDQRIRELDGFGEKSEQKIITGINMLGKTEGRILYNTASEYVGKLSGYLDTLETVSRYEPAGSFRRRKETVGDLDVLIRAQDREQAARDILEYSDIREVISRGDERLSVRLDSGLQVDFRFFESGHFGAALLYFTGSKEHNIEIRKLVREQEWKLNEYGLFNEDSLLAGKTEKAVYQRLGMDWIPPELRENRGEVEAALNSGLPALIKEHDLTGDLHAHSDRTDGKATVREMAEAARERGYEYLAITDHSQRVTVANGLNDEDMKKHADTIRRIDEEFDDLRLLAGVEVDILKNGGLDLKEKTLENLDWVVASVHSYFEQDEKKMTERIIRAVKSGVVHCLGHPCGRMIGKRDPIRFDTDAVFGSCAEHGVFLEINSHPDRMDLPDYLGKSAQDAGCSFVITTDAHSRENLDLIRLGVYTARRGWIERENVLNTVSAETLKKKI